jgi:hypothetical protein
MVDLDVLRDRIKVARAERRRVVRLSVKELARVVQVLDAVEHIGKTAQQAAQDDRP